MTLRLLGGYIAEVNIVVAAQDEVVLGGPRWSLMFPRLFGDHSMFSLFFLGDLSLSAYLLGLRSRFLSPLLFSF